MSTMYQQAAIAIGDPKLYEAVHGSIAQAFSTDKAADFLRSVDRASVRVREFELVLGRGLLGQTTERDYGQLGPGDQGQIREFYLHSLERVAPELRQRFFRLYAYY